jgi:rSAM/selenodomain-associated transferase 1
VRDVVYVVAKAPRAGHSKTRLCPPLWPEAAARLAAAFLYDTIALAARAGLDVRLICRDAAERDALLPYAGDVATVHVQAGAGLGAALESAFAQGFADGYHAVGVLGMDAPTLPPRVLAEAFTCLHDGADVALGPSADGGYYLLSARALHRPLFRDMVWSTNLVARQTLERCAGLGLRTRLVDEWIDVDDAAALHALVTSLRSTPGDVAPHTRLALQDLHPAVFNASAATLTLAGRAR